MSQSYLFPPPPVSSVAVQGSNDAYPVHRVFCVGRNYEAHAKEMGVQVDREAPFYFTKGRDTVVPSGAVTPYPPGTKNFHHEMELVVAIKGEGFRVPEDKALELVFGYACGLDMTRRDLQLAARDKGRPWDFGKDFEQATVISSIVPVAKTGHPVKGKIALKVNGEYKQNADLAQLVWSVPSLIANLSQYYHLRSGDLILTGTPEGVGPVKAGDKLEGMIEGVGEIALTIGPAE